MCCFCSSDALGTDVRHLGKTTREWHAGTLKGEAIRLLQWDEPLENIHVEGLTGLPSHSGDYRALTGWSAEPLAGHTTHTGQSKAGAREVNFLLEKKVNVGFVFRPISVRNTS